MLVKLRVCPRAVIHWSPAFGLRLPALLQHRLFQNWRKCFPNWAHVAGRRFSRKAQVRSRGKSRPLVEDLAPLCLEGASGRLAQLGRADARTSAKSVGRVSRSVDYQNGIDTGAAAALLKEARRVIIAARGALF